MRRPARGMAGAIRIVTDSSAQFIDPTLVQRYNIVVVPLEIRVGGMIYREDIDLSAESFFQRLSRTTELPALHPPPVEQLAAVYRRLGQETDRVLSIHLSKAMHNTCQVARRATESMLGRMRIEVLDSQSIAIGLGLLVEAAARLAEQTDSLDTVVRSIRKLIPHIYSIFNVEALEYLGRSELLAESQVILGNMLGIRPFLTIEEGELIAMEKTRTRFQAVDKLAEFATEFAAVDQLVMLQGSSTPTEQARQLQERLAVDYPDRVFPILMYKPSLACFIGPGAIGLMIFEHDLVDFEDDAPFDEGEDD